VIAANTNTASITRFMTSPLRVGWSAAFYRGLQR
jgi:hypothetical protein